MTREITKEDVQDVNKPIGMPCWRDKNFVCGNFKSWNDFIKWDGEKNFCSRCSDRPGLESRKKRASEEKSEYVKDKAWKHYNEWEKLRKNQTVPFTARKVI